MTTHNPWQVESLQDFSFLKCPECTFDTKEEIIFQDHAIENHPLSFVLFGKLFKEEEVDGSLAVEERDIKKEDFDSNFTVEEYYTNENYTDEIPENNYGYVHVVLLANEINEFNNSFPIQSIYCLFSF